MNSLKKVLNKPLFFFFFPPQNFRNFLLVAWLTPHPPWLWMSSAINLKVLRSPFVLAEKENQGNRGICFRIVRPYADSSELSYTTTLSRITDTILPGLGYASEDHSRGSSSFFGQSGGASRWRVCYQRGLPRLVLTEISWWWRPHIPSWLVWAWLKRVEPLKSPKIINPSVAGKGINAHMTIRCKSRPSRILTPPSSSGK